LKLNVQILKTVSTSSMNENDPGLKSDGWGLSSAQLQRIVKKERG